MTISKDGDAYTAMWSYDDGTHEKGTGVRECNCISFIFQGIEDDTYLGVQQYRIKRDTLEGPWVLLDDNLVGEEKLTKLPNE